MKRIEEITGLTGMPVYLNEAPAEGEQPAAPTDSNCFIICSDGVYRYVRNDYMTSTIKLEGGIPSGAVAKGGETIFWTGPKLSVEDFHFVRKIFVGVYDKIKAECDVQLEWSPSLGKFIIRLPHQTVSGASVHWETADDDPCWIDRKLCQAKDLPEDAFHMGRIHSHNVMNAFWSGVDTGDQERQEWGIQIVMGHITTDCEYKCRICNCGRYIDVELEDVVDFPPVERLEIPDGIIKQAAATTFYNGSTWGSSYYQKGSGYYQGSNYGGSSAGSENFKGKHWNGKEWVYDKPATTGTATTPTTTGAAQPTGEAAANGGSFPGADDEADYAGVEEDYYRHGGSDRPFARDGRATGEADKTVKTAGQRRRGRPRKNADSASTGSGVAPAGAVTERDIAPILYLTSQVVIPPCIDRYSPEYLRNLLKNEPSQLAVEVCRHSLGDDELKRFMTFYTFYKAVGFPDDQIKGIVIPPDWMKKLEPWIIHGQDPRNCIDEEGMRILLQDVGVNFDAFLNSFSVRYPVLSTTFKKEFYSKRKVSMADVYKDFVWDPETDHSTTGINSAVDALCQLAKTTEESLIPLPAYLLTQFFKSPEAKRDWLLHSLLMY